MGEPTNWTERNGGDPGITILEAVAYTLGALGFATAVAAFVRSRRTTRDGAGPDG